VDLCFTPPLSDVGLLDWKKLSHIEGLGYRHAREVLAGMPDDEAASWRVQHASTGLLES